MLKKYLIILSLLFSIYSSKGMEKKLENSNSKKLTKSDNSCNKKKFASDEENSSGEEKKRDY